MFRIPLAASVMIVTQSIALDASAVCTAGNPNGAMAESTPTSAFTDHGNGTVTHNLTGLMWKRCVQGSSGGSCTAGTPTVMTWKAGLAAAVADTTAGFTDWRMPNKKELESILENCGSSPAINTTMFPSTPFANSYWTSSTYHTGSASAWFLTFTVGTASPAPKTDPTRVVRLVRDGSSFGGFDAKFPGSIDVDGNGTADALTDGLLIMRYLFGLRGTPLIQNAIGTGAQRTTAPQIESFLQSVMPK